MLIFQQAHVLKNPRLRYLEVQCTYMYAHDVIMCCRDLTVKRQLDNNPVLWELLLCISEGGRETCSLTVCAPVIRALLTVLSQHWQRCRVNETTTFPKELASSISLIECLARVSPFHYQTVTCKHQNLQPCIRLCRLSGYLDPFVMSVNSLPSLHQLKLTYCSQPCIHT